MKSSRVIGRCYTPSSKILIAIGFILALWISTHPYIGIIQDARYYLIQTLHTLDPARWNQDLFFKYGTQDSFSLFSSGYRWFVAALGPDRANLVATLIGDALWLAGLAALILSILKNPAERMAAACGVIMLATCYGQLGGLNYAEPFVTPRLFAEAAVMGGLALALQRQRAWSAALFCLAFATHPLMAIPGIGITVIGALRRDRRAWFILGLVLLAGIIGTWLGLEPFTRAREFYDARWFQIIEARNKFVLISAWNVTDYARTASVFVVLGAFLSVANDREHKFTITLLMVTAIGCAASFLGADIAHNVLITNLQPWRALWLATLASNAAILLLFLRSNESGRTALVIGAMVSFCSHFLVGLKDVAPFAIILCVSWFLLEKLQNERARLLARTALLIPMAVTLTVAAYGLHLQFTIDPHLGQRLSSLALATTSALGLVWCMRQPPVKWLVPAVICTLVVAAMLVDQRTAWNRYVHDSQPDDGLRQFLANAGTTYWEGGGVGVLWFKARKPDYYSCLQGAQTVFFRPLALEWSRRQSALRPLNTEDFNNASCGPKANPRAIGPDSRAQIAAACEALPDLDTIILDHPISGLAGHPWTAPTYQEVIESGGETGTVHDHLVKISTFYRYSCADLRGNHRLSPHVINRRAEQSQLPPPIPH